MVGYLGSPTITVIIIAVVLAQPVRLQVSNDGGAVNDGEMREFFKDVLARPRPPALPETFFVIRLFACVQSALGTWSMPC